MGSPRLESIASRETLFVLLAAALAFAPAIGGSFLLDDFSLLTDPAFTTPSGILDLLQPSRVRPLTNLTLWANFQLTGESPLPFHLVNLLLHLAAVWFASQAFGRLLPSRPAFLATVVFALHPLQTEPVAYIYARTTILCGLFCWAAIAAWTRERYTTAVICTALALLAKEEAVALPVFFLLLDHKKWRPIAAMSALALATGLRGIAATAQGGTGAGLSVATSPIDYAVAQGYVILRYFRLFLVPVGLNFDPDLAPTLGLVCWIAILGALVYLWTKSKPAATWYAAALIFLAPTSTFLPIADLAADRRMYLPTACLAAALGLLVPAINRKAIFAIAAALAILSFNRAITFSNPQTLWRETVAGSPNKIRPRIQLARVLDPPEALRTLQGLPNEPRVASERGRIYLELARPADALREFGIALADDPNNPSALANRGTALAALNQTAAAQQDFARALARDPCFYPALANLHQLGLPLPNTGTCRFTPLQQSRLGPKSIPYSK